LGATLARFPRISARRRGRRRVGAVSPFLVNRPPGQPVDPKVAEFLHYILSRDGMAAVVRDQAFLPLNADAIRAELGKIE